MFVLTGNEKDNIAELEIAAAAAKLGVGVDKPLVEHARADLVFEIGRRLWRVQCNHHATASARVLLLQRTSLSTGL